jgi:DNA processing protein
MSTSDPERRARVWLSAVFEPGDPIAAQLLARFPPSVVLERVLAASDDEQSRFADWRARARQTDAERLDAAAAEVGARYVVPGDPDWPASLLDLDLRRRTHDASRWSPAPLGLWVRGDAALAGVTERAVAIVGSRAATAYGEQIARDLAFGCAGSGWTVVSGGAYGIDAAAHQGALARGKPTVAVLAGGVDRLYPSGNRQLLREIADSGLVVSEAPPGAAPTKSRFLVRNRLIACLAAGTVVVEAALRSGSLSTARWARDLGRSVMGVPGMVTSMASAGVHELLRQRESVLVTDSAEIVAQVAPIGEPAPQSKTGRSRADDDLGPDSRRVLDGVPVGWGAPSETVAREAGLRPEAAVAELLELERRGLVVRCGRGWALAAPLGGERG